jgi:TolA-binding protein
VTRPPSIDDRLRVAMRADDRLDDLRRARIAASLDAALDAAPARRPRHRRVIAVAVAVVAAGAMVAVGARVLRPASTSRPRPTPASLDVPSGASTEARLGGAARITLRGPAHLELAATAGAPVTLTRGTLIGSYDHRVGGRLTVRTPHAEVAVVGTLFTVEVDATTCVAVAHGLVDVTAGRRQRRLERGQRWCVDAAELTAVSPTLERLMAEHEGTAIAAGPPTPVAPPAALPPAPLAPPAPLPTPPSPPIAPPAIADAARPIDASSLDGLIDAAPLDPVASIDAGVAPATDAGADRDLYAAAEQALRYGDTALADALLARLIAEHADSALADEAHYERAQLAFNRGAWAAARASLDRLLAGPPTQLRDPARLLRCRIAVRTDDGDAAACLDALRANARDPAVALEALELRVQHAFDHSGCAAAERFVRELHAAAPDRPAAAAWRRRCPSQEPP